MSTSRNKYDAIENIIHNEGLKIMSLKFSPNHVRMYIYLTNDLTLVVPTKHYKGLKNASPESLKNFRLIGRGTGIHWPDLDEDLSLKGFLNEYLRQIVTKQGKLVISK